MGLTAAENRNDVPVSGGFRLADVLVPTRIKASSVYGDCSPDVLSESWGGGAWASAPGDGVGAWVSYEYDAPMAVRRVLVVQVGPALDRPAVLRVAPYQKGQAMPGADIVLSAGDTVQEWGGELVGQAFLFSVLGIHPAEVPTTAGNINLRRLYLLGG